MAKTPTTFIILRTASGAETSTGRADGTAVAFAGEKGIVRACVFATVKTATFLVKGRQSGREVVPNGSASQGLLGASTSQSEGTIKSEHFIFSGLLIPGEPIEVTIVAAGAQDAWVGIQTE